METEELIRSLAADVRPVGRHAAHGRVMLGLLGGGVISLGLVAWTDTRQEMTPLQRQLASLVTDRLHLLKSSHTLFNFKQKFQPCWQSRYIVASTTLALPKIALAVFRVRNYSGGGLVRLIK